jgi:FAD/FMN-containing dehydrogenase
VGPGVVVDLSRLDAIGAVDVARRTVRVGPGALRADVEAAAAAHGLRFPPDPSSGKYCTVGGMAGTNAAGAHTLKYGATRAWVAALDCVFDDGTRAEVRRGEPAPDGVPALARLAALAPSLRADERARPAVHPGVRKESSGYATAAWGASGELVELLVGSEGTLALFVGLELALVPRPGATASAFATFATLEAAVDGAAAARAAGASACELLDRTFLDVVAGSVHAPSLPDRTEAVLLAEVEAATPAAAEEGARALDAAFARAGATRVALALEPLAEAELWEVRHAASPILARLDPDLKSMQFIEDAAVPPARLPDYVRGVRAALARHGVRGVIFGHAGDAHVHVNPLVDVRRPDWEATVRALLDEVTALVGQLGGTLAGEHGDGRLRAPLLGLVWPPEVLARFAAVKAAFDPRGVLNPGAKVALAGQRPFDAVKYDRALPPAPPDARRVLDAVERDRAYARFRLAMLDEARAAR